jgi:hypothetical protein
VEGWHASRPAPSHRWSIWLSGYWLRVFLVLVVVVAVAIACPSSSAVTSTA